VLAQQPGLARMPAECLMGKTMVLWRTDVNKAITLVMSFDEFQLITPERRSFFFFSSCTMSDCIFFFDLIFTLISGVPHVEVSAISTNVSAISTIVSAISFRGRLCLSIACSGACGRGAKSGSSHSVDGAHEARQSNRKNHERFAGETAARHVLHGRQPG
jgi:hypothetical protein